MSASTGALAYQVTAGFLLLLLRWTLFSSVIMAGTAMAIRAFLFIRPARLASIRMVADWVRRLLVPVTLLVALLGASIVAGLLAWMLMLGCVWILFYLVRLGFTAEEVLRWVAEHQAHWWVIAGEDQTPLAPFPWQPWKSFDPDFPDVPQP